MAHGDYDCCAICDSKLSYSSDAATKEVICGPCVADLATHGVIAGTPDALIAWVKSADPAWVRATMTAVGYSPCYYGNAVDDALAPIMGEASAVPS